MIKKCKYCGKEFNCSYKNSMYCSKNCNSYNWNKNNKEKLRIIRNNYKKSVRIKILKRDNFTCQMCGSKDRLEIHHIDGLGRGVPYKQQNNNPHNLITLCYKCHYIQDAKRRGFPYQYRKLNRWSMNYDECTSCHTKEKRHISKGLCSTCYENTRKKYKSFWWNSKKLITLP